MRQIEESDWEKLRDIRENSLKRLCVGILKGIREKIDSCDLENDPHTSYLSLYKYIKDQDKKIGDLFNDWRRSTALSILLLWGEAGIMTKDEFESLTKETKDTVKYLIKIKFYRE